jgi:hypothetical protein
LRSLLSRDQINERLEVIFPRNAFDSVLCNPLAAAAAAAMLYIDAVVPDEGDVASDATWARPTTCLWMSDDVYSHTSSEDRIAWRRAAAKGRRHIEELQDSWGSPHAASWYRDNSRETLRDETFPNWLDYGAIRGRPGVKTTSSQPRWALTESFADLFSPSLSDLQFTEATEAWRESHMQPGARFRIATLRDRERTSHATEVRLPGGETRLLEPGDASRILRGVLEDWAPARLADPVVLSISEPGDKVYVADRERLRSLGLTIDPGSLLPDAVIVDIGENPPTFWIIEAVASDGPVTEDRRRQLLRWAQNQRIPQESCHFLSAFLGRNDAAARKRLKDLAVGTFAWYAAEPTHELAWYEINDGASPMEKIFKRSL